MCSLAPYDKHNDDFPIEMDWKRERKKKTENKFTIFFKNKIITDKIKNILVKKCNKQKTTE